MYRAGTNGVCVLLRMGTLRWSGPQTEQCDPNLHDVSYGHLIRPSHTAQDRTFGNLAILETCFPVDVGYLGGLLRGCPAADQRIVAQDEEASLQFCLKVFLAIDRSTGDDLPLIQAELCPLL